METREQYAASITSLADKIAPAIDAVLWTLGHFVIRLISLLTNYWLSE